MDMQSAGQVAQGQAVTLPIMGVQLPLFEEPGAGGEQDQTDEGGESFINATLPLM